MARVNVIKVRIDPGPEARGLAANTAIERVEKAGGRVLQVIEIRCTTFDVSRRRKTDDWDVTLLVEASDG